MQDFKKSVNKGWLYMELAIPAIEDFIYDMIPWLLRYRLQSLCQQVVIQT